MAHTTSIYYRDRLGFEPDYESPHRQYGRGDGTSTNMLEERHHAGGSSSVQRHSSHSSSYAVQQSSSSSVTQQRHLVSSSSSASASVMHHKASANGSYAYEANGGGGGANGHHANGDGVTTLARMEQRSLTGGHYEENLQQFKGSCFSRLAGQQGDDG